MDDHARVALAAHAKRKRMRRACKKYADLRMPVPCSLARKGTHHVTLRTGNDGALVFLLCECDDEHGHGVANTSHRLGAHDTCGHAAGLLRAYISDTDHDVHKFNELFGVALGIIDRVGSHSEIGRTGNSMAKPAPWVRPSAAILSRMFGERFLNGSVGDALKINTDDFGRPVEAKIGSAVVAKRCAGTSWLIDVSALGSVKGVAYKAVYVARGTSAACRVCLHTNVHHRTGERAISGKVTIARHFTSTRHMDNLVAALADALGGLPGCGGSG